MQAMVTQDCNVKSRHPVADTVPTSSRIFAALLLVIALATALAVLLLPAHAVLVVNTALYATLALLLAFATCTDLTTQQIPNQLTYASIVASLALVGLRSLILLSSDIDKSYAYVTDSFVGAIVCGSIAFLGWQAKAIGGGDVKLLFAIGLVLGLGPTLEAAIAAHSIAVVFLIVKNLPKEIDQRTRANRRKVRTAQRVSNAGAVPMAGFYTCGVVAALWFL
jgi:Flp pilus assembly protein protease CpaA